MTAEQDLRGLDQFEPETGDRTRGRRIAIWSAVVVAILVLGYGGLAWFLQDKVPNNTAVAGVPIGGLDARAAEARLTENLGSLGEDPLQLALQDRTATIVPAQVGLELDVAATVDSLTSFSLDPRILWAHLTGSGDVPPISVVDEEALVGALDALRPDLETQPVEGSIAFAEGAPVVTEAADGYRIDTEGAVTTIVETWLTEPEPLELPVITDEPAVTQDAVDEALREVVEPLVSGPVTVTVGEINQELSVQDLTAAAAMEPVDGRLELRLDGVALRDRLEDLQPDLASDASDARIVIQDGGPAIIPSATGRALDPEALAAAVAEAALSTTTRSATVSLADAEPEFTTADAEALGVREVVSEFSTPLTSDNVRTQNLVNGTRLITNTLVKPDETFSLIKALGPITEARGFVSSGVVEDGFVSTALGGGLSQLSTTTYNAAYFAGMELVEHKPHSRWFSRYPEGREATLWAPDLDMKFENSTPYGVLVQAWVSGGRVWVRFWSTPYFEVRTETSNRYNITQPQTVYNDAPDCVAESGGEPGFTVKVTRWRYLDGSLFDTESWTWTYSPWNRVVCGSAP